MYIPEAQATLVPFVPDEIFIHIFTYLECGQSMNLLIEYDGLNSNKRFCIIMKYMLHNYIDSGERNCQGSYTFNFTKKYPLEIINLMIELKSLKLINNNLRFYIQEDRCFRYLYKIHGRFRRGVYWIKECVKNSTLIHYCKGYEYYITKTINIKPMSDQSKKIIKKLYHVKTSIDLENLYPHFDFQFEPINTISSKKQVLFS